MLRHGFDERYRYSILALLATSTRHSENRAIAIVIVRYCCCDYQQWLRPLFTLACVTKTHHMHGMHIEALRQLGVAGVTHTRAHTHLASLPMVSTTDKAGAVWWHWVQEQRSRAYGMDAGPKAADPEKIGAQIQTDVMITVTGSAIWSLHAAGR